MPVLVIAALLFLLPRTADGQVFTRPDSAALERSAAIAKLLTWVETTHGVSEQSVMLRNTSTRPIQIVNYEVYQCVNVRRRTCKVHSPGPVIQPGKTIRLVTIVQDRDDAGWSFRYRFTAEFTGEAPVSPPPVLPPPDPGP